MQPNFLPNQSKDPNPPFNPLSHSNLNLPQILKKSNQLISQFNFPSNFLNYCEIVLKISSNSLHLMLKFPTSSYRINAVSMYFLENSYFPISDALKSYEILHNGDNDFRGKTINYPEFSNNEAKVSFSKDPGALSLLVRLCEDTFTSINSKYITDRRGNKEIVGLMKSLKIFKIFIKIPEKTSDYLLSVKTPSSFFSFSKLPEVYNCPRMQSCYNFLISQDFNIRNFDGNGNRCYCSYCFPVNWIDSQSIGGEVYIIPRGWARFGLKMPIVLNQQNNIWENWCNAFHGTNPSRAKSIIEHNTLLINKDIKIDGVKVSKNCSREEWNKYFVSPHICYASHPWYSQVCPVEDRNGKKRFAQVVLICKIRYGIYQKQPETEGGQKKIFDDYSIINENEIEWFSDKRGCIVPYGVLVRSFGEKKLEEINRLSYVTL